MKISILALLVLVFAFPDMAFGAPASKSQKTYQKHLRGEKVVRGKDVTNINMDEAQISTSPKRPMDDFVTGSSSNKDYDFVKIRLRWHPEMVQSVSSLDNR